MLSDKLKELRVNAGYRQIELCSRLGLDPSKYNTYEKRNVRPSYETLKLLADFYGISVDELVEEKSNKAPSNVFPLAQPIRLAIYGEIAAGTPINTCQSPTDEWIYEDPAYGDGSHFALRVKGCSMEPEIPDGSIAIIRHQNVAEDGQIVAVIIGDNCATLKRYKPQSNGIVLFQASNPSCSSYICTPDMFQNGEVHIIGILREIKRKFN